MKKKIIVELTDLAFEILTQALDASIRDYLISAIESLGIKATEEEIEEAWEAVSEKIRKGWQSP